MSTAAITVCAVYLLLALISVVLISFFTRRRKPRNDDTTITNTNGSSPSSSLPLPPGSMGWPYVGETLRLYSEHPHAFFSTRQRLHGDVFKTSLLGCPSVMLAAPEAAKFVLAPKEANGDRFRPTYPKSKERLIGPSAVMFQSGAYHARVRRLVMGPLMPDSLKRLVPLIEDVALDVMRRRLDRSQGRSVISTFHVMKEFSFEVGFLIIFGGQMDAQRKEELWNNYRIIDKAYNSFPTMIPGTAYHKAVQARNRQTEIIKEIIAERRREMRSNADGIPVPRQGLDVLSSFIMSDNGSKVTAEGEPPLTDEQIVDNVNGVLFAAQDTTASILTWITKYLDDNPKLLQAVKSEQMGIRQQLDQDSSDGCGEKRLTWALTRHMTFTHKVILESLRMASIITYTFREAVTDVEYKGYLIPKGWKVMPLFRNIHYNPEFYPDPNKFDPSRFDAPPKPNTFLAFGSGAHSCPGNELAKLEMLVFLHHLVTKYAWEAVGGAKEKDEIEYVPFVVPKGGLPAKFWRVSPGEDDLKH